MSGDAATRLKMAHALIDVGRREQAAVLAREVLAADPDHARALCALARALDPVDLEGMLAASEAALAAAPDDDYAHRLRSIALRKLGRSTEAVEAARRSVELDPHDDGNHWQLAKAELAAGRTADAYRTALRVRQLAPDDPATFYLFTDVFEAAGEHTAARAEYRAGLQAHPTNSSLLGGLAYHDRITHRYRAAALGHRAGLSRRPTDDDHRHGFLIARGRLQSFWVLVGAVLCVPVAAAHALALPAAARAVVVLVTLGVYVAGLAAALRGIGWAGTPRSTTVWLLVPILTMLVGGLTPSQAGLLGILVIVQVLGTVGVLVELGLPVLVGSITAWRRRRQFRRETGFSAGLSRRVAPRRRQGTRPWRSGPNGSV